MLKVKKWGNSYEIRIGKEELLELSQLNKYVTFKMVIDKGDIVIVNKQDICIAIIEATMKRFMLFY